MRPIHEPSPVFTRRRVAAAAALLLTGGCGEGEVRHAIEDVRTVADPPPPAPRGNTEDQRFGAIASGSSGHAHAGMDAPVARRWRFTTPPGWTELPPARMRDHGWRAGADGRAECTLSLLEGAAGGLSANVNRWRQQMSVPPLSEQEVAALPVVPWLGVEARRVEIDGIYVGMGGGTRVPGARLLGLVATLPSGTAFLKLTGPVEVVATERPRFLELAASLRRVDDEPARSPSAGPSAGHPALSWTVPAGWLEQPARPLRVVTFSPEADPKVSVYVTVLAGRAGGLRMNVDRWYGEMGKPPPSPEELAALPRGTVLGGEGVYVDVEGTFAGMGATAPVPGARLLGMVRERDQGSVFVKMTGPADGVARERERFRAFCESLRE